MTDSSHTASDAEEARLADLAEQFMRALEHKRQGRLDHAEDDLLAILKTEPRLPEPRMELARIYLDTCLLYTSDPAHHLTRVLPLPRPALE